MDTRSSEVEEIYREMAAIRREPHDNVSESVAGAEAIVEWGRYAWMYPWVAMGAAAVTGYLIYTGSRRTAEIATPDDTAKGPISIAEVGPKEQERKRTIQSLLFAAGGIVLPVAINAGQNYVLRWLEKQNPTRPLTQAAASRSGDDRADGWKQTGR